MVVSEFPFADRLDTVAGLDEDNATCRTRRTAQNFWGIRGTPPASAKIAAQPRSITSRPTKVIELAYNHLRRTA